MTELYFDKFPMIEYNGYRAKNLTKRVTLSSKITSIPTNFYPYELKDNLRPDQVAAYYYEDATYDWLIYLTNQTIDPYYGWYLSNDDFNNFIIAKYGSLEEPQQRTAFYRLNWGNDLGFLGDLPVSVYENNLPKQLKKYYTPNYGYNAKIISYKAREEDWTVNTNKIDRLTVNSTDNFISKDLIKIIDPDEEIVGTAEIIKTNNNYIYIQHVEGTFFNDTTFTDNCVLTTNTANSIITAKKNMVTNLSAEEFVYWQKVTYYDYETEKNEAKKFITLLDANYALPAAEEIRKKIRL